MDSRDKGKFVKRRRELKITLFKFLKKKPNGIAKDDLWNEVSRSCKIRVAAHYYGVSKMHNLLEEFDDMLYESRSGGKPHMYVMEGYTPSDFEDSGSDSDVQIDHVSSSKPVEVKQTPKTKPPPEVRKAETETGGKGTEELSAKRDNTSPSLAKQSPLLASNQPLQSRSPVINVLPLPTPLPQQALFQSPVGYPVRQLQPALLVQPFYQPVTISSQLPNQRTPTAVPQSARRESFASITSSETEDDFPELGKQPKSKKETVKERKDKLKENLVRMLADLPQGIKKTSVWTVYRSFTGYQPSASDFGVKKLTNILDDFDDILEEFVLDDIPFIKLRGLKSPKVSWGQGAVAPQMRGLSTVPRELSSSTSSLDSQSNLSAEGFMAEWGNPEVATPSSQRQRRNFIDLTDDGDSFRRPRSSRNSEIVDLTKETRPKEVDFISFDTSPQPQQNLMNKYLAPSKPSPMASPSFPQIVQQAPRQPDLGVVSDVIDLTEATAKPISNRTFERKEVRIPPIRAFNSRRPPSREQLNEFAQECIDALADANEHVSPERIENLLVQRFGARSLRDLNVDNVRYIDQLNCVNEHNRGMARVNAYSQAFVKVRSICTLHELKACLTEWAPDKEDFSSFKFGPFQRMPVVYQLFKFPTDMAEIPEITSMDILEHLRTYMSKYNKWTERLEMEEFMKYLVEVHGAENAYVLGVRIRSLPLAAQVLKKAQRDVGASRRSILEEMKKKLKDSLEQVFHKFRMSVMHTVEDSTSEVRPHYLKLRPETAIKEIFEKFNLIVSMDQPTTRAARKRQMQFLKAINDFVQAIKEDERGAMLFHLAICVSNTILEEAALELLAPSQPEETNSRQEDKQPPRKDELIASLKKYLERCLMHGALKLSHLDMIEEKLNDDYGFSTFSDMRQGTFLKFLIKEAKTVLEDCGGTSIGSGTGGGEGDSVYKPQQTDILEFLLQCKQCGIEQNVDLETALCQQFGVKDVKQLGHGNITRLRTAAERPGKHQSKDHSVLYEAALSKSNSVSSQGQVGILGHQPREAALACLHNCPLLEDMAAWSQWNLVFEPEHGKLKDFVQKYGGVHTSNIEGGTKLMTTDIMGLETRPGHFLKLISNATPEKFEEALIVQDVPRTCGMLMSMVVANRGIDNMPLALLSNHVKSALFSMHASDTNSSIPGAPPVKDNKAEGNAVEFVLACLHKLPLRSCVTLANKVFLEPLGHVVGTTKSKTVLWQSCQSLKEQNRLQQLGCLLGINEWTQPISQRCRLPVEVIETIPSEEAQEFFGGGVEEEEEMEDSEEEEELSDESSILSSDDEDDQTTKEETKKDNTEEKPVVLDDMEDLIVVDESDDDKEMKDKDKNDNDEDSDDDDDDVVMMGDAPSKEEDESEVLPEEVEEELSEEEKRDRRCLAEVENIRRDEFGIGVELNEDGERLMKVHQERLGRSLDRLSKDLYSKDTHFVLELVQNADDNSYPEFQEEDKCPSCEFVMREDAVIVLNNENGFEEKNIRALCDVGKSTKGKHKFGYIGQKGIGFKSVFRVTDRPEVHSNGYHICFDAKSGPMGYILPHWTPDAWEEGENWTTKIVLPLKEESHTRSLAARFNDIHPSLLLFLHRLRQITIQNQVETSKQKMKRRDLGNNVVEIQHNYGVDRFLVVKKSLDASKISLQAKSGVEVESTEIALAFPLRPKGQRVQAPHPRQHVFAFLPLRSYGFRFIVQGDFDVPSSREDVDRDSPWNQWIRNEIHTVFIDALEVFKSHQDFKAMEAVTAFLQFVPMEDEILDFFRPVASQILQKLKAKACIPTQPNNKGMVSWKIPSQTVTVRDPLIREVVTPEILQKHLNLFYIHRDIAEALNTTLTQCLGIDCLTTDHLIQIGKALCVDREKQGSFEEQILQTAKWLACIYRSLEEFHDNQAVIDTLRSLKTIPLSTYEYVSIAETTVFFSLTEDKNAPISRNDPLMVLQADLNTIHPLLINTPDNEVNSQVQKLLHKLGVCQLSAQDVVSHHIIPTLKSEESQNKSREILISYMVYIKENMEKHSSLVNIEELASIAKLVTNHGVKNPKDDEIHFTPLYGNKYDLPRQFPGYDWTLIDGIYLNYSRTPADRQRWCEFLSKLGVDHLLCVRPNKVEVTDESVKDSPWAPLAEFLGPLQPGYYIQDYTSRELVGLIQDNQHPASYQQQMKDLFEFLDQHWNSRYSKFTSAQLRSAEDMLIRDTDTSLSILLRTYSWLPAVKVEYELDSNNIVRQTTSVTMMPPSCLYLPFPQVENLMAHTVMYLQTSVLQQTSFRQFLKLKISPAIDEVKTNLVRWGERQDPDKATVFFTSMLHIKQVYKYLQQNLPPKQTQDLVQENPVIFVPMKHSPQQTVVPTEVIAGKFLLRSEVWWNEKTGLFAKYKSLLQEYHMDLARKEIINLLYLDTLEISDFLLRGGRVSMNPSVEEYGKFLIFLSSVLSLSEKSVLPDILLLYETLGSYLQDAPDVSDTATKNLVLNTQKTQLLTCLKGRKVFATKKMVWASMEEKPLIADNKDLEKFFKDKTVHFLDLEDRSKLQAKGRRPHRPEGKSVNFDQVNLLLELCGIKKLSEVIETQELTEMFSPCPTLQLYLHQAVHLIQSFLYSKHDNVYQDHKDNNITQVLQTMQFVQVSKLEVRYSIKDHPNTYHIHPEKCLHSGSTFYFHKDHLNKFQDINKEIAKFFSCGDKDCATDLQLFLNSIEPILTGRTQGSVEEYMEDIDPLPVEEEQWYIPAPIIQPVKQQPVVEEKEEAATGEGETDSGGKPTDGERKLTAWPPMSDASGNTKAPRSKVVASKTESSSESKVWPPPKAPDYLQSVKQLPSQVKVVDTEVQGRGDNSGENKSITSDKKDGTASIPGSSKSSDSGATNTYSRQSSVDGENMKRKRAEDSTSEGVESKRHSTGSTISTEGQRSSQERTGQTRSSADQSNKVEGESSQGQSSRNTYDGQDKDDKDKGELTAPKKDQDRQDGATNKRRHPTGDNSSPPPPTAKKSAIHLGMPVWTESSSEFVFEELGSGSALQTPQDIVLEKGADSEMIGKWGEVLVFNFLLQFKEENADVVEVIWKNEQMETGLPYDFEIHYHTDTGLSVTYIEVKSTLSSKKEIVEISAQQLKFAQDHKDNFHIYRVFNAGDPHNVKLVRIDNLSQRLDKKEVRLCMLI